ncbi:MAG: hypothetical protein JWL84_6241 [Rhodospirillales bacterium]|nr:hypothetical protein [Rhodospirillales bacterium]
MVEFPVWGELATEGADVKRINQYEFYELGQELSAIHLISDQPTLSEAYSALIDGKRWMERLLSGSWIELAFSKHEAQAVLARLNLIFSENYQNSEGKFDLTKDWNEKLPPWAMNFVKSALTKFENNLAAELREASTYYVVDRGIYNTSKLVESAEHKIPGDLRNLMNPMAVKDFHDAGRCLAFNLPTASGLHSARAVEGVLVSAMPKA